MGTSKPLCLGRMAPTGQTWNALSSTEKPVSPSLPLAAFTMSFALIPRPVIPNTFFLSTSRLARTQSSQRMQRLKSSTTSGWDASMRRSGKKWVKCGLSIPV